MSFPASFPAPLQAGPLLDFAAPAFSCPVVGKGLIIQNCTLAALETRASHPYF